MEITKDFLKPILALTIICLVVSGALALMNNVTRPIVTAAAAARAEAAMNSIIPGALGFTPIGTDGFPASVREAYRETGGAGYIFIVFVNGYGGEIKIICGIAPDGRMIHSSTVAQTETKGLGSIIADPWFEDQFDGKDSSLEGISTVTGATISTRAFINGIKDAFEAFEIMLNA
jgi:electron transport complex protein RnfG